MFAMRGREGFVTQFYPPSYFCEPIPVTEGTIGLMSQQTGGFIAVSRPLGEDASVVFVSETKAGSPCLRKTILDFHAD